MKEKTLEQLVTEFICTIECLPLNERRAAYGVTYMLNTYIAMKERVEDSSYSKIPNSSDNQFREATKKVIFISDYLERKA